MLPKFRVKILTSLTDRGVVWPGFSFQPLFETRSLITKTKASSWTWLLLCHLILPIPTIFSVHISGAVAAPASSLSRPTCKLTLKQYGTSQSWSTGWRRRQQRQYQRQCRQRWAKTKPKIPIIWTVSGLKRLLLVALKRFLPALKMAQSWGGIWTRDLKSAA